jgi:hypothetical protein
MLHCASSPYARRGALWNACQRHFAKPTATLVWQADTRTMNPTISQDIIQGPPARPCARSAGPTYSGPHICLNVRTELWTEFCGCIRGIDLDRLMDDVPARSSGSSCGVGLPDQGGGWLWEVALARSTKRRAVHRGALAQSNILPGLSKRQEFFAACATRKGEWSSYAVSSALSSSHLS